MNKDEEKEINRLNGWLRGKRDMRNGGVEFIVCEIQNEEDKKEPDHKFALYKLIPDWFESPDKLCMIPCFKKEVVISRVKIEDISNDVDRLIKLYLS